MNKSIIFSIIGATLLISGGCDSQLDIVPKGQTTLDRTADLELLLNQKYDFNDLPYYDLNQICGEGIGMGESVSSVMASTNTLNYAYLAYDENVDRVTLAQEDAKYSAIYKYINYMNTILVKIDDATGLDERKPQLKAEARIMRAYLHWLCVNIYAAQYDAATAAGLGGIAYVTDIDNTKVKEKLSLAEVYEKILEDCSDEVIALLPESNENVCRAAQDFGNAVRGRVLMQMKRYTEALPYLERSIELNPSIDDRAYIKESMEWQLERESKTNLLYISGGPMVNPTMEILTRESFANIEKNDYVKKYCNDQGWNFTMGSMFAGLEGYPMCMSWTVQGNPWGFTSVRTRLAAAECLIRTGDIRKGLEYTDIVRKAHVENPAPYVRIHDMIPFAEVPAMKLLQAVKWVENFGSFENFFDMKRWNTESNYTATVSKDLDIYGVKTLAPDSKLWILPFPAKATRYNPTLTQNF